MPRPRRWATGSRAPRPSARPWSGPPPSRTSWGRRDAEAQALLLGRLLPVADHVALRAHVDGVPLVKLRVPQVEVVVVRAHADEVAGPGLLVEGHQPVRVPLLRLPERDDVLVAVAWRDGRSSPGDACTAVAPGRTCAWRTSRPSWAPPAAPSAPRCRTWRRGTTRDTGTGRTIRTPAGTAPGRWADSASSRLAAPPTNRPPPRCTPHTVRPRSLLALLLFMTFPFSRSRLHLPGAPARPKAIRF